MMLNYLMKGVPCHSSAMVQLCNITHFRKKGIINDFQE